MVLRCEVKEVLQTGAFVPIHALGEEKHAYRRLMLSSLIPLAYVPKPKCILRQRLRNISDAP